MKRSLPYFILIAGVILTLMAFMGRLGWIFELATHFRVQYVFLFSFLGILFAVQKRWIALTLSTLGAVVHLLYIFPGERVFPTAPDRSLSQPIKVMFSNVYVSNRAYQKVLGLIDEESPPPAPGMPRPGMNSFD